MIVQNRFIKVSKKTKNAELCENCCAIKSFSLTLHSFFAGDGFLQLLYWSNKLLAYSDLKSWGGSKNVIIK